MRVRWLLLNLYKNMNTYTIDATNKKIGRVASQAATYLMGKNLTSFARNEAPKVTVTITNTSKADIHEKKRKEKEYVSYSGYPGGIITQTLEKMVEKKGYSEVFRNAVYGMLPSNKLKTIMMKNLVITE